jgi:prophage regulatory protein
MPTTATPQLRLLRLPEVLARRGRKRSAHYRDIADGTFTPPARLGPRCSAWPDHEVEIIIRAQIAGASPDDLRTLVRELLMERLKMWPSRTSVVHDECAAQRDATAT